MNDAAAEAAANFLSLGIAVLLLGWALSALIDEIKDYVLDKMREKYEREKANEQENN